MRALLTELIKIADGMNDHIFAHKIFAMPEKIDRCIRHYDVEGGA